MTLKVSRARAVLPSEKQRRECMISMKSCKHSHQLVLSKAMVGPLLPDGRFRTKKDRAPDGARFPTPSDWGRKAKSLKVDRPIRYEPVSLPIQVLESKTRRALAQKPSRNLRKKLRTGKNDTIVYPTQSCVRAFHRRGHALNFVRQALDLLVGIDDHTFFIREIDRILGLLPEIFLENPKFPGAPYKSLRNQLSFFKRSRMKDQTHDLQSRREALIEPRTV